MSRLPELPFRLPRTWAPAVLRAVRGRRGGGLGLRRSVGPNALAVLLVRRPVNCASFPSESRRAGLRARPAPCGVGLDPGALRLEASDSRLVLGIHLPSADAADEDSTAPPHHRLDRRMLGRAESPGACVLREYAFRLRPGDAARPPAGGALLAGRRLLPRPGRRISPRRRAGAAPALPARRARRLPSRRARRPPGAAVFLSLRTRSSSSRRSSFSENRTEFSRRSSHEHLSHARLGLCCSDSDLIG